MLSTLERRTIDLYFNNPEDRDNVFSFLTRLVEDIVGDSLEDKLVHFVLNNEDSSLNIQKKTFTGNKGASSTKRGTKRNREEEDACPGNTKNKRRKRDVVDITNKKNEDLEEDEAMSEGKHLDFPDYECTIS